MGRGRVARRPGGGGPPRSATWPSSTRSRFRLPSRAPAVLPLSRFACARSGRWPTTRRCSSRRRLKIGLQTVMRIAWSSPGRAWPTTAAWGLYGPSAPCCGSPRSGWGTTPRTRASATERGLEVLAATQDVGCAHHGGPLFLVRARGRARAPPGPMRQCADGFIGYLRGQDGGWGLDVGVAQPRLHLGAGSTRLAAPGSAAEDPRCSGRGPGSCHSAGRCPAARGASSSWRCSGCTHHAGLVPVRPRAVALAKCAAPLEALVPLPDGVPADELALRRGCAPRRPLLAAIRREIYAEPYQTVDGVRGARAGGRDGRAHPEDLVPARGERRARAVERFGPGGSARSGRWTSSDPRGWDRATSQRISGPSTRC